MEGAVVVVVVVVINGSDNISEQERNKKRTDDARHPVQIECLSTWQRAGGAATVHSSSAEAQLEGFSGAQRTRAADVQEPPNPKAHATPKKNWPTEKLTK